MLNLDLRKAKQETTAPQIISFHRTPQREKHKHHTPKGLRSPQHRKLRFYSPHHRNKKKHQHRNTANPHVPLLSHEVTADLYINYHYTWLEFFLLLRGTKFKHIMGNSCHIFRAQVIP